jgi:hypothetical protein
MSTQYDPPTQFRMTAHSPAKPSRLRNPSIAFADTPQIAREEK